MREEQIMEGLWDAYQKVSDIRRPSKKTIKKMLKLQKAILDLQYQLIEDAERRDF